MNYCYIARNLGIEYNVTFRVIDKATGRVVSEQIGHNQATNSMLLGIGHYLKGDGVLNQGNDMLGQFVPRYISLGTMGLLNQNADSSGLPAGIGVTEQREGESDADFDLRRYTEYMEQVPGYGADGYNASQNNNREYFGLGPVYSGSGDAVKCELISASAPRAMITYREVLPEAQSELPETVDIVFSAYVSTGALAQFRNGKDYVYITEVGMWNDKKWRNSAGNGLIAAYRIIPPNSDNWDMTVPANRKILQENVLRVGKNQIVQVIWKIQLGSMEQFGGYVEAYRRLLAGMGGTAAGAMMFVAPGIQIQTIAGHLTNLFSSNIEVGAIQFSDGQPADNDARLRTTDYAELPAGRYTVSWISSVVTSLRVFKYQTDETYIEVIPSNWTDKPYTFTLSANTLVKFSFNSTNGTTALSPSDMQNIVLNKIG